MPGHPFGRRSFLTLAAGATAAATGAVLLGRSGDPRRSQPLFAATSSRLNSRGGLLELDLTAEETAVSIPGGPERALTYNGLLPGPLLELQPGDAVRLRLHNRLDQPTNLHYHGLHIPPGGQADNVFLSVAPGASQTYDFQLPANHPAGTFYYHPHRHGTVADQVFGGLGGVLIVRGALDRIPEVGAAQEQVLFLKDLPVGWENAAMGRGMGRGRMLGREGSALTVNGQVNPDLTVPAGALLRLRIVNGSNARFWRLALEDHPFHLIATDGGALEAPVALRELLLAPGERAEVLVQASRAGGRYRLLNLPYARAAGGRMGGRRGGMGMGPRGGMGMGPGRGAEFGAGFGAGSGLQPQAEIAIATLTYAGAVAPQPLPERLLPVEPLPPPVRSRRFELNHGMAPGMGMVFLINGRPYAPHRTDTRVRLGDTEDWDLVNTGVMDHPFHVHINPFQVISRNGRPEPYRAWMDVVLVRSGETVRIRTRFTDFPGRTVYHCHILDHEELGMMGNLEITT
ncbi:multicopper oxidase family protein [Cyanobium sp. NIES-981]|uniref:multicopper oxidase family protein n=1 Tax=Cyanobium sp. NIES-981 TaxID=1851505 RepID=UPI0007DE22A6|nr:multicopper oxidase family protein [Cyanobium sp. NIES-981]SBO44256.1 Multicopper oxidase, type 3 [Cyanobium sp. NIES-981]